MKTIKCMMDHLYWADGRILDALEESETKNKDLLKLVRHVAVAERVWLSRLQGKGSAQSSLWEEAEDLTAIRTMFEETPSNIAPISKGRGIRVGRDDRLCEQRGVRSERPPGTSVAGPLTSAISPGTDQPGT